MKHIMETNAFLEAALKAASKVARETALKKQQEESEKELKSNTIDETDRENGDSISVDNSTSSSRMQLMTKKQSVPVDSKKIDMDKNYL